MRRLLLIFMLLTSAALAQDEPESDTWLKHMRLNEAYWQSDEGKLRAIENSYSIGLLQYKEQLEAAGWSVEGLLECWEVVSQGGQATPLSAGLTKLSNGFQTTGGLLALSQLCSSLYYDDPALYRGAYIPEAYREPLKEMVLALMANTLSEGGTLYVTLGEGLSLVARRAFWVSQGADLILKAGNYFLVQPFFDTYERMWWLTYQDYFLKGEGFLSTESWFAICQEGKNTVGFPAAYKSHMNDFWEEGRAGQAFVEFWAEGGDWQANPLTSEDSDLAALKENPGKLPILRGTHKTPDRAERNFSDRFMARFYRDHLNKPLTLKARELLAQESDVLKRRMLAEKQANLREIERSSALGALDILVRDRRNPAGLSGASLKLVYGDAKVEASAVTDAAGQAHFKLPAVTRGEVVAEAQGFAVARASFTLHPSTQSKARVELLLEPISKRVQVTIRVRDAATNAALPGATVQLGQISKTSDADGIARFEFEEAHAGPVRSYSLRVSKELYSSVSGEVKPGEYTANLAPATVQVSLTVVDASERPAAPLAGATVKIGDAVLTSGAGGVAAGRVPASQTLRAEVAKAGYSGQAVLLQVQDGRASGVVELKRALAALDFLVGEEIPHGEGALKIPLEGVRVKLSVDGGPPQVFTSDKFGRIRTSIPAGETIHLTIYKEGFRVAEVSKTIVNGKVSVSGTLKPTARGNLAVKLRDATSGQAVGGASVRATWNGGGIDGQTNSEGVAYLPVPPNQGVQLEVASAGYQTRRGQGQAGPGETRFVNWDLQRVAAKPTPSGAATAEGGTYRGQIYLGRKGDPGFTNELALTVGEKSFSGSFAKNPKSYYGILCHGQFQGSVSPFVDPMSRTVLTDRVRIEGTLQGTCESNNGKETHPLSGKIVGVLFKDGRATGSVDFYAPPFAAVSGRAYSRFEWSAQRR